MENKTRRFKKEQLMHHHIGSQRQIPSQNFNVVVGLPHLGLERSGPGKVSSTLC